MAMIIVDGRTTKDATVAARKIGDRNTHVANFRLVENIPTSRFDESGKRIYEARFYDVALWGDKVPNIGARLTKGRHLLLTTDTWKVDIDKRNNQMVPVVKLTNPQVKFLDAAPKADSEPAPATEVPADVDLDGLPFEE